MAKERKLIEQKSNNLFSTAVFLSRSFLHMGQRSTEFSGHSQLHPEHGIYYGSVPNFRQPTVPSVIPDLRATSNFILYPMREHQNSALYYGMTQYNGAQHQHPSNINLAIGAPSGPYYPYMACPQGMVGIPMGGYGSNIPHMDRKIAEGVPINYQYHNASAGSSSSVAPMTGPTERDHGGNEPMTSMVENELQRSVMNRSGVINNQNHLGSYFPVPIQAPGTLMWTQALSIPYSHASVNGTPVESLNVGVQSYQVTAGSRNASSSRPSIPLVHPILHSLPLHTQGITGYNINFPSQVATSSHTNSSPYPGVIGGELLAPVLRTGFQFYGPQQRDVVLGSTARQPNLPNARLIPENGMAMVNIPGYHEAGVFIDQHWDMRLDVDHMTYEELLVLGEHIGMVSTGLSEEEIRNSLKTKTFSLSEACSDHEEAAEVDQQSNFCVICQNDFEDQENIAALNCGHGYHGDCVKKWLLVKNTCPICKSTALTTGKKES